MGELHDIITRQLKPNYKAKKVTGSSSGGGMFHIYVGDTVVKYNNLPVAFIDRPGFSYRRQVLSHLRKAGVLQVAKKKTNTSKDHEVKKPTQASKPEALALVVLRDVHASARERKMAREYMDEHERLMETQYALELANKRNDELSQLIQRYVAQRRDERGERLDSIRAD